MATGGKSDLLGIHCPICLTVYKDPRALACCHTFCLDCLIELTSKTKDEVKSKEGIKCPICGSVTKNNKPRIAVEEFVHELPINHALVSVLNSIGEKSENEQGPNYQPCLSNCDLKQTTEFCQNCKENKCANCASFHKKLDIVKDHTFINLSNSTDDEEITDFSHLMKCNEHGKRIKFFCNTHNALCCSTCAITVHRYCDFVEVKHVKQTEDLHSCLRKDFAELRDNFETACKVLDETVDSTYSDIAQVEEEFAVFKSRVLKKLEDFENRIRVELEANKMSIKLKHGEKKGTSDSMKAALHELIRILDSVNANGSPEAKVIVIEKLKEQKMVYQIALESFLTDAKSINITLEIRQELEAILESNYDLGHLGSLLERVPFSRKLDRLLVMKTIDLKAKENKEEPWITGLDILQDERIVMVDFRNRECLIMNKTLHLIASHALIYAPLSLTILSTNEVVISNQNGMKIYKVTDDNTLELTRDVKVNDKLYSLSETNNKDELVACLYDTNEPLQIIERRGNKITSVGDFPDVIFTRHSMHCVFSKVNNFIIASLSDQNEIRIIDNNTKETKIITNENIKSPTGLVTDDSALGSFFVCSGGTKSIVQMSFEGTLLTVHELDIMMPFSVAISADCKKLVVSNDARGKKRVAMFQLSFILTDKSYGVR